MPDDPLNMDWEDEDHHTPQLPPAPPPHHQDSHAVATVRSQLVDALRGQGGRDQRCHLGDDDTEEDAEPPPSHEDDSQAGRGASGAANQNSYGGATNAPSAARWVDRVFGLGTFASRAVLHSLTASRQQQQQPSQTTGQTLTSRQHPLAPHSALAAASAAAASQPPVNRDAFSAGLVAVAVATAAAADCCETARVGQSDSGTRRSAVATLRCEWLSNHFSEQDIGVVVALRTVVAPARPPPWLGTGSDNRDKGDSTSSSNSSRRSGRGRRKRRSGSTGGGSCGPNFLPGTPAGGHRKRKPFALHLVQNAVEAAVAGILVRFLAPGRGGRGSQSRGVKQQDYYYDSSDNGTSQRVPAVLRVSRNNVQGGAVGVSLLLGDGADVAADGTLVGGRQRGSSWRVDCLNNVVAGFSVHGIYVDTIPFDKDHRQSRLHEEHQQQQHQQQAPHPKHAVTQLLHCVVVHQNFVIGKHSAASALCLRTTAAQLPVMESAIYGNRCSHAPAKQLSGWWRRWQSTSSSSGVVAVEVGVVISGSCCCNPDADASARLGMQNMKLLPHGGSSQGSNSLAASSSLPSSLSSSSSSSSSPTPATAAPHVQLGADDFGVFATTLQVAGAKACAASTMQFYKAHDSALKEAHRYVCGVHGECWCQSRGVLLSCAHTLLDIISTVGAAICLTAPSGVAGCVYVTFFTRPTNQRFAKPPSRHRRPTSPPGFPADADTPRRGWNYRAHSRSAGACAACTVLCTFVWRRGAFDYAACCMHTHDELMRL